MTDTQSDTTDLCDCERGHNGLGMSGRECDCKPDTMANPDWIDRPANLRQIAEELDFGAQTVPCSEASICREAADEIEELRRIAYGEAANGKA